jgi:hypothetical protein
MMKSNITIAPNIYVRSSVNAQNDEEFIKRVYGHKALNILKTRFPKSYASRLTRAQIEEMKQNVICRHGKTREHAYGKALLNREAYGAGSTEEDGHASAGIVVWSCRCEHTDCHAYEKCMSLPNAVRINRDLIDYESKTYDDDDEFKIDDSKDDVFEPPRVSVVLPVLTEILSGGEAESEQEPVFENPDGFLSGFLSEKEEAAVDAESFIPDPDKRVLVICESVYELGYFSTILYKNKVRHRILRSEGYTLSRRIADVFWDYCAEEIDKDAFFDRCLVRVGNGDAESELSDFYDTLFKLCGDSEIGEEGGLRISHLADALNESPELISECVLNMDGSDFPVTLSTLELLTVEDEYDDVMLLEGKNTLTMRSAVKELFGSPPLLIKKESLAGWLFSKSALGRPCRIGLDNYRGIPGRHCINVEFGLWGDVDGKCFLADHMGDAIRLQLYIAEKIRVGDELTIEKNSDAGGYWYFHNGNILGEVPDTIIREVRSIEGFPDDFTGFEGIYVRDIVTCISEKDDLTVPSRFRETRIWLGLDITGYAKVLI